jgi:FkbM family methyltransferase
MFSRSLARVASIIPSSVKYPLSGLRPLYTFVMGVGQPIVSVRTAAGPVRWRVDGLTSQTFMFGTYEPYMQEAFVKFVHPGSVVYDVGSHAGYHTVLCALLVGSSGSTVAFEPNPANFRSVRQQLKLNSFGQVTLSSFALSDQCGKQRMDTSVSSGQTRVDSSGDLEVEAHTLDCLVETRGFSPPSVIKIDVEGHEGQVLKGALRTLERSHPVVICDYNDSTTLDTVTQILRPLGYEITAGPPITAVPKS